MFFSFSYYGLLLLSLVGIELCGFSQILQIYVCKLIVGDEFLIDGVDSDLLLLAVVICTTIVGGLFYLRYIVLLWKCSWTSGLISLHCCPCDYLGPTWGNQLIIDVYCCHCHFQCCWCFIFHEMESWFDYEVLKVCSQLCESPYHILVPSVFNHNFQNCVTSIYIH